MKLEVLQQIGLTEREAEIYLALLKLGEVPVSALLKVTGAHPQVVYRALESLVAQELVFVTGKHHRKYVRAEKPQKLLEIERERYDTLKQTLPDLLKLQTEIPGVSVKVTKGDEAVPEFRAEAYKLLDEGEVYCVLSGAGRYRQAMGKWYGPTERIRIRRKVQKHLVAFQNDRADIEQFDTFRDFTDFRYIETLFPTPTSINFYRDTTGIIIWSREPVVIRIDDAEVTQSYRDRFNDIWKIAKQ